VRQAHDQLPNLTVIPMVDRLDHTKGIPERLAGFLAGF
jgi:trehalose-6-phosphate synthase